MFIAALFVIAPNWKQPKCSLGDEQLHKLLYPHNGILLSDKKGTNYCYPATWMNLTNTQSERTQSEWYKINYYMWPLNRQNKPIMTQSKSVVAWGWGLAANMHKVTSGIMERFYI